MIGGKGSEKAARRAVRKLGFGCKKGCKNTKVRMRNIGCGRGFVALGWVVLMVV